MANLQAIGFDGETIIYLLADGTGTDLDPFVSKFALTDGTITAIENILPEFVFDGDRLLVNASVTLPDTYSISGSVSVDNFPTTQPVTGDFYPEVQDVNTGLDQPLTLAELQEVTVKVEEQNPVFPGFNLPTYDKIELGYTGENVTTVTYKLNAVTVATLTLGYTNNVLTSVERTN